MDFIHHIYQAVDIFIEFVWSEFIHMYFKKFSIEYFILKVQKKSKGKNNFLIVNVLYNLRTLFFSVSCVDKMLIWYSLTY